MISKSGNFEEKMVITTGFWEIFAPFLVNFAESSIICLWRFLKFVYTVFRFLSKYSSR